MDETEAQKKIRVAKETKEAKKVAALAARDAQISKLTTQMEQMVATQQATVDAQAEKDEAAEKAAQEAAMQLRVDLNLDDDENGGSKKDRLDELSRSEFADVILSAVDKSLGARSDVADQRWESKQKTLVDDIAGLKQVVLSQVAQSQVAAVREEFKDFDEHKEQITAVMKAYPGIAVRHAYILAKSEAAGDAAPKSKVETEKPTSAMTHVGNRRAATKTDEKEGQRRVSGLAKFRSFVDEGIDKVLAARGGE